MPSVSNHSPGARPVSRAGSPASKNAGELDALAGLIAQSEASLDRLLEATAADEDRYQAALSDLAAQSAKAAASLLDLERVTGDLPASGETR